MADSCPDCVFQAGCQRVGCDCLIFGIFLLEPPTNPPNAYRPPTCPACITVCFKELFRCPAPTACTIDQLDEGYVLAEDQPFFNLKK